MAIPISDAPDLKTQGFPSFLFAFLSCRYDELSGEHLGDDMAKAIRVSIGLMLGSLLAGCASSGNGETAETPMPLVTGLQLDVALSEIEAAGFSNEVEIVGGGTFGVVNESNWTVCEQSPAAGQALANPLLTVDRECDGLAAESTVPTEPTTPELTTPPVETVPVAEPTSPTATATNPTAPTDEILTIANSPEFAAILAEGDYCADSIRDFAATNKGRVIEFDGHIANVAPHPGRETRWDFLLSPGEEPGEVGPAFKFEDVGRADLNLTNESIPGLSTGDNLHIVAKVVDYNAVQCLFFLDPVSTGVR